MRAIASLLVFALAGGAAVVACTLTTSFDGISDGVRPTDAGDAGPALPPARPAGDPVAGGGRTLYLGVKHFHFAHSNDALKVPGAWQDWGYDIDGLCTGDVASAQAGTCIRNAAITPEQVRDGKNCRDNNFGSQIVPLLNIYNGQFENDTNTGLGTGAPAWLVELDDLGDGSDDPYVPAKLYLAAPMPPKQLPAWDGTDVRSVLPRSVSGSDVKQAVVSFPKGYLKGNVWVSGEPTKLDYALPIGKNGELMPMPLEAAIMSFQLRPDHVAAVDGTGQVAGAMRASSLDAFLAPFLYTQTTFCPATAQWTMLMNQVTTFSDVVIDAPHLQDPSKACDGVSFGFGINLAPVAQPTTVGAEVTASTGLCGGGDAGTSDAGDSGADTGSSSDTGSSGDTGASSDTGGADTAEDAASDASAD